MDWLSHIALTFSRWSRAAEAAFGLPVSNVRMNGRSAPFLLRIGCSVSAGFESVPMINRRTFLTRASVLLTSAALPSAFAAFAQRTGSPATLHLVSPDEMRTLRALVDVILPATDSPAASAADTHLFVDFAAQACATSAEQAVLRAGLNDLESSAQSQHRQRFADLSPEQQTTLLTSRAEADVALPYERSFFKILKDYTLVGYFHSKIGATQALAYEQIPGGYEGDLPLKPGQKAWAI